nr:unknown [Arabidopsis thaliana]
MSSFTIPSPSSFSLSNSYNQTSPHSFILRNSRSNFEFRRLRLDVESRRRSTYLRSNCSTKGTDSGENENKSVLDAFFLGKALAEVINERIESTVGEVLSTIGKFQAEQQKQVQEIQEEVLERAKKAKERAARETMEEQGLVASKPVAITRNPDAFVVTSVTPTSTVESKTIMVDVEESSSSSDED